MSSPTFVLSELQSIRQSFTPPLPEALQAPGMTFEPKALPVKPSIQEKYPAISQIQYIEFQPQQEASGPTNPLRIGVVLSGGQAPGGHNVIMGVFDYVKRVNPGSQVFGFLGGPRGIFTSTYVEITPELMNSYRNQGGFDMICSGRDKIETPEQYTASMKACKDLGLNGLIVIGGDDSNTNAALLADYFLQNDCQCKVIGCPKTIDGDLKNEFIEISFGFDTATKVYSEVIGNLSIDALSTKKYYHFIRLMGRSASHIALQCALQTRPNVCLIGEEVMQQNQTLQQLVDYVANIIMSRSQKGKNYGVVLVPEGLIEFIPEVNALIGELNEIMSKGDQTEQQVCEQLTENSRQVFDFLPTSIKNQLLLDRDPHGNVQVAKIETERLLILLLKEELPKRGYPFTFLPQAHYFGYEGRCALPSNFDSAYCYALGQTAGALVRFEYTGMMSVCRNLKEDPSKWQAAGVPLAAMMDLERRKGKDVAVITKALVELDGSMFKAYQKYRDFWSVNDCYRSPGPIQFDGPTSGEGNYMISLPTDEDLHCDEDSSNNFPYAPKTAQHLSNLAKVRANDEIEVPEFLTEGIKNAVCLVGDVVNPSTQEVKIQLENQFAQLSFTQTNFVEVVRGDGAKDPKNLGVVFLGRNAPGGHNVIDGLLKAVQSVPGSKLFGVLGGNTGILQQSYFEITEENFAMFRNQGGFDFLGRNEDSLRSADDLQAAKGLCEALQLDGLVLIGATHTLTDAARLAEFFLNSGVKTRVIGVPASVDNNLKHPLMEATIGFDTASRVNSQLIGNLMTDSASATKYWYFIRLMGRDPSHLVLEAALQTHPNIVIISEKHARDNETLSDIVGYISDIIQERAAQKKLFGTILIPEGLLDNLSYFNHLFREIGDLMKDKTRQERLELSNLLLSDSSAIDANFSPFSVPVLKSLPHWFQEQILTRHGGTGSIQLSQIETERLIQDLVTEELNNRKKAGATPVPFAPVSFFFGYQGRCSIPSKFDCSLGTVSGLVAASLIWEGKTGYATTVRGLNSPASRWRMGGIPLTSMMAIKGKSQYGINQLLIPSSVVDLSAPAFQKYTVESQKWVIGDHYTNPGPIQFFSDKTSHFTNLTLQYNHKDYLELLEEIHNLCGEISNMCRFGADEDMLRSAKIGLSSVEGILKLQRRG